MRLLALAVALTAAVARADEVPQTDDAEVPPRPAATARAAASPGPVPPVLPPLERPSELWLELTAGPVERYTFGEFFSAAHFELTLGRRSQVVSAGLRLGGDAGRTEHGLSFGDFTLSPGLDFRIHRVHLAFFASLGALWIQSVTSAGPMTAMLVGVFFAPSVELVRGPGGALFLGLRGGVECLCSFGDSLRSWTLGASLGWRL